MALGQKTRPRMVSKAGPASRATCRMSDAISLGITAGFKYVGPPRTDEARDLGTEVIDRGLCGLVAQHPFRRNRKACAFGGRNPSAHTPSVWRRNTIGGQSRRRPIKARLRCDQCRLASPGALQSVCQYRSWSHGGSRLVYSTCQCNRRALRGCFRAWGSRR